MARLSTTRHRAPWVRHVLPLNSFQGGTPRRPSFLIRNNDRPASDAGMHAQWPATRPPFAVGGEEEMDLDSEMVDMQQQRVFFIFFSFFIIIIIMYQLINNGMARTSLR
jgi:hypothetical protein